MGQRETNTPCLKIPQPAFLHPKFSQDPSFYIIDQWQS